MKLRIGSRASRLAVIQTELVMDALRAVRPDLELELVTMTTTGDRILDRTLEQIGGKGLFVRELDRALLAGEVDLCVHSLKDLPMQLPPELPIAACFRREDPRDALVLRRDLSALPQRPVIGTASKRRALQIAELYENVEIKPVRGNVQTRLAKLDAGDYDALILAAAGLKRCGLAGRVSAYLDPERFLPAAGQGILAVQSRAGAVCALLSALDDPDSRACALAERSFASALEGGCTAPTCAYATAEGETLRLRGLYQTGAGDVRRGALEGPRDDAEALGRTLAERLRGETL